MHTTIPPTRRHQVSRAQPWPDRRAMSQSHRPLMYADIVPNLFTSCQVRTVIGRPYPNQRQYPCRNALRDTIAAPDDETRQTALPIPGSRSTLVNHWRTAPMARHNQPHIGTRHRDLRFGQRTSRFHRGLAPAAVVLAINSSSTCQWLGPNERLSSLPMARA